MEEYLSYDRMLAMHRNQINPRPNPEHTMTFAVDHMRFERMGIDLSTTDDILRKKTLIEINADFRQSLNIMSGINAE